VSPSERPTQFGRIHPPDVPVDKMGIGWAGLWNAVKRIAAGASAEEKQALFSATARRVYRLDG
jgi:predicted TIM-barrel fold metal-dependent hydrolase